MAGLGITCAAMLLRAWACCILAAVNPAAASDALITRSSWPNGPFSTSGRWIVDASGANVTYAGVNWPGHVDCMLPEGLQYESVGSIVSQIKSLGMNAIRLTYAIEMIDQIYENGGQDVPILTSFVECLGPQNGTAIFDRVVANNPAFNNKTTRLQVFDAVAAECAKQEIYVHLDNHMSSAGWCCSPIDGNGWWGDTYFSIANWTRGLSYMANHGKSWTGLVSMSLRNEPRLPLDNFTLFDQDYNWEDWYANVRLGAAAVHANNSGVLVFLPGKDSDANLSAVVQGTPLTPGTATFSFVDFPADKLVLELHDYVAVVADCADLAAGEYADGFEALTGNATNAFPVVMTEFGFQQDATTWEAPYPSCLGTYLPAQHAGWTIWVLAGSYYTRSGAQDVDETWGLLTHDWSAWRSPEYVDGGLLPLVRDTLAFLNQTAAAAGNASGQAGNASTSSGASSRHHGVGLVGRLLPSCFLALGVAGFFGLGL